MTLEELRGRQDELVALCQTHGVSRLDVFGSVVRQEASPDSDLDLLVALKPSPEKTYLRLDRIERAIRAVLLAEPDLVLDQRVTNPYVRRQIEHERQNLYGA
ncbi:nucleotidyltransferase family protein [soil metagenome]